MENSEHVFYFQNEYFKNGNLKSLELSGLYNEVFDKPGSFQSLYTYDRSNRLISSLRGTVSSSEVWSPKAYDVEMSYDKDGNFIDLVRNDSGGARQDEMKYLYYSNTNKVRAVLGSHTQYQYDYNGNVTKDSLNWNSHMMYDYRNLLTQVTHREKTGTIFLPDTVIYLSFYDYDETGNRTRKRVFKYIGTSNPSEEDGPLPEDSLTDNPSEWQLVNNEVYSRGADGKELCIYQANDVEQWNIWGADNLGTIKPDDVLGYKIHTYLKDHLGSIRVIVDDKSNIISAQDYDPWGYTLRGRYFDSEISKFKFIGKERDKESGYDYFGARYYDSRIGRWGGLDALISNSPSLTPYNYSSNSPLTRVDPSGLDDYYFMLDKTVKVDTDADDRWFVEHEEGSVKGQGSENVKGKNFFPANSYETGTLYQWDKIDLNFKEGKFVEAFESSMPSGLELYAIRLLDLPGEFWIMRESVHGKMDQKFLTLNIPKTLFLFDGVVYNRNEAANIVWGAVNANLGVFSARLAQIYADIASREVNGRPDEPWDQRAIQRGWYYYDSDFKTFYKPKYW